LPRSRRKAREAALQALYKISIAKSPIATAVEEMREHSALSPDLTAYAQRLIEGVRNDQAALDARLSRIIREYDYDRVAVVDKIAAFELFYEPSIPPAVTIDEAIEIARKYSTEESGRFVNGILGKLLEESPKADWDPSAAPPEEELEEPEEAPEVVEETIAADSEEAKRLSKGWKVRTGG